MTSYERMHLAMRRQKADRVPVMCQLSQEYMERNSGVPPFEMYHTAPGYAEAFCRLRRDYAFDGILLNVCVSDDWEEQCRRVERTSLAGGAERFRFPDGAVYEQRGNRWICTQRPPEEPHPEIDEIDVNALEIKTDFSKDMALHKLVVEAGKKEQFSVHGEIDAPMNALCILLGLENAMMALLLDPEKCHRVFERYIPYYFAHAKAQIDVGVDAMKISSPFVGSSFISRPFYEEFVVPYEKELTAQIHAYCPGIPVYTHTCGFIGDRLELMRDTGINGIECMDPAPLGDVELADAKRRVGSDLFLKGNMDSVNVLLQATDEELDAYVKQMIADGGKDGGYILSSACSVAPGVRPELLRQLTPLAEKYGTY